MKSRNFLHLMKPQGSSLCSQESNNCHHEPDKSTQSLPILLLYVNFNIILQVTCASMFCIFLSDLPPHNPSCVSLVLILCHIPCPSHATRFNHLNKIYFVSTNHPISHYVIFSSFILFLLF